MRVNIYNEELTTDVEVVEVSPRVGKTYYGVRLYLASSDKLHHTESDDDRSAVTIWVGDHGVANDLSNALYTLLVDAGAASE